MLIDSNVKFREDQGMLEVYLVLYDTLNDDDEDVRDQGAATASTILSRAGCRDLEESPICLSLSPPAAKRRLSEFVENQYHVSTALHERAIERLVGARRLHVESRNQLPPVSQISAAARKPQTAVFVEEKQNLYIDHVREAETWAEVLTGLHADSWDIDVTSALHEWVAGGLSHFRELFEDQVDGPLGPTSNQDIFTLMMRVLLAAKVLISRVPPREVNGDASASTCENLLRIFYDQGGKWGLHPLLLTVMEDVLGIPPRPVPDIDDIFVCKC